MQKSLDFGTESKNWKDNKNKNINKNRGY